MCRPWQYKHVCVECADLDSTSMSVLCVQTLTVQACLCCVCRPWQYSHVCVACADLDNTNVSVLRVQTLTVQACLCCVCRPWQYKHVCVLCADLDNISMSVLCVQTLTIQACLCCVCRPRWMWRREVWRGVWELPGQLQVHLFHRFHRTLWTMHRWANCLAFGTGCIPGASA